MILSEVAGRGIERLLALKSVLMYRIVSRGANIWACQLSSMLGAQRHAPSTPEVAQRHVQSGSRPMKCVDKKHNNSYPGGKGIIERQVATFVSRETEKGRWAAHRV
jgi:hypothetical protein